MTFKEKFLTEGKIEDCPIIDMHAHGEKFYGATLPLTDLDKSIEYFRYCNVKKLAIVTHSAGHSPNINNTVSLKWAKEHPEYFRVWLGINPNYPELYKQAFLDFENNDCVLGFKTLGDYFRKPLSDDLFRPVFEYANEKGCGFLLHTWEGPFDSAKEVEYVLKNYPNIKVSAGHSLHGEFDRARNFALDYPNFYMDIVAVPDEREVIEKWFSEPKVVDKIFFGTDYPWFSYHYYLGGLLDTGLDEESIRKICYKNAERVFPKMK